jgi:hypothetical protein
MMIRMTLIKKNINYNNNKWIKLEEELIIKCMIIIN